MSAGGGRSNFRMTPVRPDGKTRQWEYGGQTEIVGCHVGDASGLNIANPEPGKTYQWVRNDATSRMLEMRKGGRPVQSTEGGASPAYTVGLSYENDSDMPTPLDTNENAYKDVVLFEYQEEVIAERHQQDAARAERMLSGAGDGYLHGASPAEMATSQSHRTRFARREHNTRVEDATGAMARQWTPDSGIFED